MLGSMLVDAEVALLPVITNSNQLTLMLPACKVSVAHPIFGNYCRALMLIDYTQSKYKVLCLLF
jgi:hypothetical protein